MSRQKEDACDGIDTRRDQWHRELPDLDTEAMAIFGRMRLIGSALSSGIEAIFARHGLDRGQFDVIATLRRSGPPYCLRPTELYRSLMMSSGGMTDRLARLAKAGLITRHTDPGDTRSLLVQLTDRGRQIAEQAFREDMAWERSALDGLAAAERHQLEALLRKLRH